jgi:ketosteroid isomerase-like protein
MSQENVELVRAFYTAAREGAWDAAIANRELVADDVEFDLSAVYPDAPLIRGFDHVVRWATSGPWGRSVKLEAERLFDVDDERVLALVRVTASGVESGVPVEMRDAHELTIRDGVLRRVKVHPDQQKALGDLGLR